MISVRSNRGRHKDPTIIAKLVVHQDRAISRTRERERERDQTHIYWYIPSTPRVNYSLLVMDTAGMMNMASDDDLTLRQGAGMALDWFFMNLEACGGGTPDLGFFQGVSGFIGIFGAGHMSRRFSRGPQDRARSWLLARWRTPFG